MIDALAAFHFIRPMWVMALIPITVLWWVARLRRAPDRDLPEGIAPHLAQAL